MATWQDRGFDNEAAYQASYAPIGGDPADPAYWQSYFAKQQVAASNAQTSTPTYAPNGVTQSVGTGNFADYLHQNPSQQGAYGYLQDLLGQYNLQSLTPFVQNLMQQGYTDSNLITQQLQAQPEFKAEFPEIAQAQAQGLSPLKPGDVINTRSAYQTVLANHGIDSSYLSKDDLSQMIVNGVSASELDSRIGSTITKINSDTTLAPQLQQLYGIGITPGEMAAYFLDPNKTEDYLNQKIQSATAAARSQQAGFGQLNQSQAESIGNLGLSDAQLRQGFGTLSQEQGLLAQGINETSGVDTNTALQAQFDNNGVAQNQLQRRLAERQSSFSGGGNFADPNKSGLTGAGASNT